MLIEDLADKISKEDFYHLIRSKLNGTLVRYKDWWWSCEISLNSLDMGKDYGYTEPFIFLSRKRKNGKLMSEALNSLHDIDIEPTWLKPGMHYCHHDKKHYKLVYNSNKSYKAALSLNIFSIKDMHGNELPVHNYYKAYLFNAFELGKYPTLSEAIDTMVNERQRSVPLSHNLALGLHPYVDAPTIYYGKYAVAHVDEDLRIHPSAGNDKLVEYLKHIGEIA